MGAACARIEVLVKPGELLNEIYGEMVKLNTHINMFVSSLEEHNKCLREYNDILISLPNIKELIPTIKRDSNYRELLGEAVMLIGEDIVSISELEKKLYE